MILGAAPDVEVVAAVDALEAIDVIRTERPDVVLLDIRMPGRSGLDILAELREFHTPPIVAVLTTFDTDEHIARALRLGASGFLVKDTDPEQLPVLVRSLAAGGVVLSPQVSRTVFDGYVDTTDRSAAQLLKLLTPREGEVLRLMMTGKSNTEIGQELFLSTGTVKDHVSAILAKLNVSTRLEAALIGERGGITTRGET